MSIGAKVIPKRGLKADSRALLTFLVFGDRKSDFEFDFHSNSQKYFRSSRVKGFSEQLLVLVRQEALRLFLATR